VCAVCSTVAEAGAKFCNNCGSPLTGEAGVGDADPRDLSRYVPAELLTKLRSAEAGHAMRGERRVVTMLFADLKGSTEAAEQLDPEDWAEIANGAFQHLIAPIYRYEGTLARLQGDAILAFFGAPIAHEDDPVRALRAALEIIDSVADYRAATLDRWGIPIEVRVGVNTGLVVVGEVGSDLRVEYSAMGDAINVAARMEQTAEPGTVRVTDQTLALTHGMFDTEELGPVELKGKADPVTTHRVVRFVGRESAGPARPIIGREAELDQLDGLRARLMEGRGWIASIIADAGVGKSRLIREFRRRAAASQPLGETFDAQGSLSWVLGASRSYDSTVPFATLRDMLARWWDLDAGDQPFERVQAAVAHAGMSSPEDVAAYLAYIGGVALPEEAERFISALETPVLYPSAGAALADYAMAVAGGRPMLLVMEDLHWADDLSLAFVDRIMELTEQSPIGLVFTMRPYREDSTWHIHEVAQRDHSHRYHHIDLSPLADDDRRALLDGLLGEAEISQSTRDKVLERSDGNPLFLEEMVRALREAGPDDELATAVPDSLGGMLTARLDRLEDSARLAVQLASVLGSEFERGSLDALVGGAGAGAQITDLLRRRILIEADGPPGRLAFRHALMQETAYGTILRRTRRELHRRVADNLIEVHPDAVEDIARHLVEADDVQAAFPYLIQAGIRATRSMALADAIEHLKLAVDNTPLDAAPKLVEQAHQALGEAYALVPDLSQSAAAYQRLYDYGETAARPTAKVAALNHLAYTTAALTADLGAATKYLENARLLAIEIGDDVGLAEYHMNACFVASLGGDIDLAVEHDEATVELGERTGTDSIRLAGLIRRATNYAALLSADDAAPAIAAALAEATAAGMDEAVAMLRAFGESVITFAHGDFVESLRITDEAQPTLERFSSFYAAMNQARAGGYLLELGDLEGALARFVDGRRIAKRLGQRFVAGTASAGMANVYAQLGMVEPIAELRAEAEASFDHHLGHFLGSTTLRHLGLAELSLGDWEAAAATLQRGLEASSVTQYLDRCALLAGRSLALTALGDLDGAHASLQAAQAFAEEKGFAAGEALLAYTEGRLEEVGGHADHAERAYVAAQAVAGERGQRLLLATALTARARLVAPAASAELTIAARVLIDDMADSITDPELRASFEATWAVAPASSE
jgi:class 3 adenylate cyclase/tetratricopeptide (TPR) repeat protein